VTAEDFKTKKAGAEKKTTEPMKASAVSLNKFQFPIGRVVNPHGFNADRDPNPAFFQHFPNPGFR
jgi:hypothetical protein